MKTRIVYPKMWLDDKFAITAVPTKLLFCYLINNPQLGLSRYLHITDRQILFDTGITINQLETGKKELAQIGWCYFAENWVYHHHLAAYVDYDGRDRVVTSKEDEIASVPEKIKEVFKGLISGKGIVDTEPKVKGLITGYKPVLNHKSETINHKSETLNPKEGGVGETEITTNDPSWLLSLPDAFLEKMSAKYDLSAEAIQAKAEEMHNWYLGNKRRNRRDDWQATLRNALSADQDKLRQRLGGSVKKPSPDAVIYSDEDFYHFELGILTIPGLEPGKTPAGYEEWKERYYADV